MRVMASVIFTAILATLFALSATAQTRDYSTETIDGLHRAAELMESVADFFWGEWAAKAFPDSRTSKSHVPASERDFVDNCRKMKEAASLFLRFAQAPLIADAIASAGESFEALRLPRPPTVQDAVAVCDKRRNLEVTKLVARTLHLSFNDAWQSQAADAKYGPIIDNLRFYGAIARPSTAMDLLRNIKWALDHDAVLRDDFFTRENMKRFFGTAAPVKRTLDRIQARWEFKPSEPELAAMPSNFARFAKCIYAVGRLQPANREIEGGITISCNYDNSGYPTFDDVRRVFGEKWQDGLKVFGPPLHGPPLPPTAPHGNQAMVYDFDGAQYPLGSKVRRRLSVEFRPNASLTSLSLSEKEF
jgi:hypothetical protein